MPRGAGGGLAAGPILRLSRCTSGEAWALANTKEKAAPRGGARLCFKLPDVEAVRGVTGHEPVGGIVRVKPSQVAGAVADGVQADGGNGRGKINPKPCIFAPRGGVVGARA